MTSAIGVPKTPYDGQDIPAKSRSPDNKRSATGPSMLSPAVTTLPAVAEETSSEEKKPWTAEVFATDKGLEPFTKFIDDLDDFTFAAMDAAIENVLLMRGIDLASTEWLKPLGRGLHEFRVRHDAAEITQMFGGEEIDDATNAISPPRAILLRIFVHFYGNKVILLLSGYDKGDDPSGRRQQREIAAARRLLTAWDEQQRRNRKTARRAEGAPPRKRKR